MPKSIGGVFGWVLATLLVTGVGIAIWSRTGMIKYLTGAPASTN